MNAQKKILVADNEQNIRTVLGALLEQEGYQVTPVANGQEAQQVLNQSHFDAVITDLKMPEVDGMQLLHWIKDRHPEVPVLMITAFATVETAVEALKLGAFDYITKPFDLDEMKTVVDKACRTHDLAAKEFNLPLRNETDVEIIGRNPKVQEIYALIRKIANSPSPVLITGESGTGKGLIAAAIHQSSLRKDQPFIQTNCAAIPETLLESEFFGYERGAFTGAVTSKPGRFELADKGTLFLDEIGEISLQTQVKLLRAVQDHQFERVGGVRSIQVDLRLITATNRDLKSAIGSGRFREDLFYRLNVIPIHVPALRERIDDIPLLAHHFVEKFAKRLGKPQVELHPDTIAILTRHSWPGNIRELENFLERTLTLTDAKTLLPSDLPEEIMGGTEISGPIPKRDLKAALRQQGAALERELIQRALEETGGNVTKAAKQLGISRKSLQTKMRQYGLRDED